MAFLVGALLVVGLPGTAHAAPPHRDTSNSDSNNTSVSAGWDGKESRKDTTGQMENVRGGVTHAAQMWEAGFTGEGIDVAIIDSGVATVEGLDLPGKVLHGPDLSFESQGPDIYVDTFGHGTHLAGIIAGRDDGIRNINKVKSEFVGMAPDARIVSLKVADRNGVTDVSQVIAAIDWVVQHRNTDGLNIRVLTLAYGTDSIQDYQIDPLSHAVEQAWRAGIVVVVAAGNDGNGSPLRNPATNPFVITVGATDSQGTGDFIDDELMGFSSCGTPDRHVDVGAPGKSIESLVAPSSTASIENPDGVNGRYIKGSGTSQATAVVAGAVALLAQQRPNATPDQIKALITGRANPLTGVDDTCQGSGVFTVKDLYDEALNPTPVAVQTHAASTGIGSLEAARGSVHIESDGVVLDGEQDIFGNDWVGASWSSLAAAGASWSGGDWNGASWSGASWSGASWSGASWSGASWSGASWSGASWSGASWSGASWSGNVWHGISWA
ncbi:MAG: S8 family serine peptidase [Acidimicrobiia bacterium]|nr:S8 family serine peptidase [Acidimicrobiia bacterium]